MVKSLSLAACAALAALAVAFPYHPLQRLGYDRPTARFFGLSVPQIDIPAPHDLAGGALGVAGGVLDLSGGVGGGEVQQQAPVPVPKAPVSTHKSWYLILHEWVWTTYVTWSFDGHPLTTGLTWGVECKGVGCQTKTGFVGFEDASRSAYLSAHGVSAVGSTEHSHAYGKVFCPEDKFMTSMNCKDRACTSMELVCAPLRAGLRAVYGKRWGGVWAADHRRVYCRQGEYIDGIECVGSCTKHFNIFCSKVEAAGSH